MRLDVSQRGMAARSEPISVPALLVRVHQRGTDRAIHHLCEPLTTLARPGTHAFPRFRSDATSYFYNLG